MSIYWIWHSHIYMGLGTWKNSEHRFHDYSLWDVEKKNLNSPALYGPWDLEKFHARASSWALGLGKIPRRSLLVGSGTWKNSELCLYTGSGI